MVNQTSSEPGVGSGSELSLTMPNMISLFQELAFILKNNQETDLATQKQVAGHLNNILVRMERRLSVHKYYSTPWFQLFLEAQDLIVENVPNPYYFKYREYEFSYWAPLPRWLYRDLPTFKETPKVLDLGIGYGTLAVYCSLVRDCELYGLDFNSAFNENVRQKFGIQYQQANLEKDDIRFDTQFDVIIFTEILEHFNFDPVPTLHKIKKLLKPGGILYLSTPDAAEWGHLPQYATWRDIPSVDSTFEKSSDEHVYQYEKAEIDELLAEVGFKVLNFDMSAGTDGRHFVFKLTI